MTSSESTELPTLTGRPDDTEAMEAWLWHGTPLPKRPDGVYRITRPILYEPEGS